ncbi:MAG: metallophosphoesterase family protein [Rhizobiales bacterium]|nr:metallophosphoesterase family protein [Hyphomicrobiales bacterium]
MRIHFVSDLHCDIRDNSIDAMPDVDADVSVVAGDAMAPGTLALRRVRALYPDRSRPLIYVPGNHDYYSHHDLKRPELKTTWQRQKEEMPVVARELGITLLDDAVAEIDGVRFIGATLWSDFSARPGTMSFDFAVREACSSRGMNDYRYIKVDPGRSKDTLRPRDTVNAQKASRAFIEGVLATPFDGETVVVTHHAPTYYSLRNEGRQFDDLDWCYASNLEALMHGDTAPALWLHGHIHVNRDLTIGTTRVVANPRGYPMRGGKRENPDFDPAMVIEVGRDLNPKWGI